MLIQGFWTSSLPIPKALRQIFVVRGLRRVLKNG